MSAVNRYRPTLALCPDSVPIDKSPVDLEAEAGSIVKVQVTVAQFRMLAEDAISQRISLRPTVGFDPQDTTRRSKHKMPVQLGCGMRSEHYAVLLGEMSYAQGLGEAGARVASNCTYRMPPSTIKSRTVK